jgi:glycosyltransferase involved in cell wall biosynthesis
MWNFAKNSSAYFKVTELSRIDGLFSSLQNEQIIVQPGFISRYKGHLTSLEAMRVLPDNVHLVILGEIHEVQADSSPDPASMTTSLVETLNQMPLSIKSRIHFISNPSDLEIAASIHSSDAVLLPYIDTGQSGSGPFSESLSLGAQILCSNIPAFRTERSSNPNIHYFDVGNIYQIRDELEMMYRRRELSLINGRRNVSYPWKAPRQLPNYKFFLRDLVEKCLSQQV